MIMHLAGRIIALVLAALILLVTPLAFWTFNLNRVAMDSQTYKTTLDSQNYYANLLPVLITSAAQTSDDPEIHITASALSRNLSSEDRLAIADKLLPAHWLKSEVEGNIDRLFMWLNGQRLIPDINIDLTELRFALTNTADARAVAAIIVPGAPPCKADQTRAILASLKNGDPGRWTTEDFNQYPVCNPANTELHQRSINVIAAALVKIGQALPDRWDLGQELSKAKPNQINPEALTQFRALVWLISRLVILLFLIPIGLFSAITMITIRSGKSLARWIGGLLILSGLLTLIPVVLPFRFADLYEGTQKGIETAFGASGPLLNNLLAGMVHSIDLQMTPGVLVQAAIAVGIGFIAVLISVILPYPEPRVEQWQVAAEQQGDPAA
jgi:hypothetical protein